jgi:hypothetical protein
MWSFVELMWSFVELMWSFVELRFWIVELVGLYKSFNQISVQFIKFFLIHL